MSINNEERADNSNNEKLNENYIIANINIDYDYDHFIINSYENLKREYDGFDWENIEAKENEKEIKECEIYIDDKKINFSYAYGFEVGKHTIKYKFNKILNSTNFMFAFCEAITSLDLSHFNSQNITNMQYMFYGCKSLESINFSNFITTNVEDMKYLFFDCEKLISLDLSKFDISKCCKSLH